MRFYFTNYNATEILVKLRGGQDGSARNYGFQPISRVDGIPGNAVFREHEYPTSAMSLARDFADVQFMENGGLTAVPILCYALDTIVRAVRAEAILAGDDHL